MQNVDKLAALIERTLMNTDNRIIGPDALQLLLAVKDMRGDGKQALERQFAIASDAKREKLSQIDVRVRGLEFHELHACVDGAKNLDLSDVYTTLTVYYTIDYDDAEGPQLYVRHIVTTEPLTFLGTNCEHIVFAAIDVMPDLCEHRKAAIIEDAEELIVSAERDAA